MSLIYERLTENRLMVPKGEGGGEGRMEWELGLADTKDYKQTG